MNEYGSHGGVIFPDTAIVMQLETADCLKSLSFIRDISYFHMFRISDDRMRCKILSNAYIIFEIVRHDIVYTFFLNHDTTC